MGAALSRNAKRDQPDLRNPTGKAQVCGAVGSESEVRQPMNTSPVRIGHPLPNKREASMIKELSDRLDRIETLLDSLVASKEAEKMKSHIHAANKLIDSYDEEELFLIVKELNEHLGLTSQDIDPDGMYRISENIVVSGRSMQWAKPVEWVKGKGWVECKKN